MKLSQVNFSDIRQLIVDGNIDKALDNVLEIVKNTPFYNAFIVIQLEHKNWCRENNLGLAPKQAYKNRINFAILSLLSEIEQMENKWSRKKEILTFYEQEILNKLNYLLTLDKKDRITNIFYSIQDKYPQEFRHFQEMSIYYDALQKYKSKTSIQISKEEIASDKLLASIKQELSKLKESAFLDREEKMWLNDFDYFKILLTKNPSYLATWMIEHHHKSANVKLLLVQVEKLTKQYERLKVASFIGLIGYAFGKIFQTDDSVSPYGKKYDEEGYDKNGLDFHHNNKGGYDLEGYNRFGYDKSGFMLDNFTPEIIIPSLFELEFEFD